MWVIIIIIVAIVIFVIYTIFSVKKVLKEEGGYDNYVRKYHSDKVKTTSNSNNTMIRNDTRLPNAPPTKNIKSLGFYDYTNNKPKKKQEESSKPSLQELIKQNSKEYESSKHHVLMTATVFLAWRKTYQINVVGAKNYQSAFSYIAGYKQQKSKKTNCIATLVREPNNIYDSNAVMILIDKHKVGYLSKDNAKRYVRTIHELGYDLSTVIAVRAIIIGGWKDEHSEGNFGARLDLPDFSRFRDYISKESFDDADKLVKASPLSDEQKIFFRVLGLDIPDNVNYSNFTRYKNKKLKELQQTHPELYQKWQEHIAVPEYVYSEKDVYDFWNDKDERELYDIKKPKKAEMDQAIQVLLNQGQTYEDMVDDPDLVYEELLKINPSLEK